LNHDNIDDYQSSILSIINPPILTKAYKMPFQFVGARIPKIGGGNFRRCLAVPPLRSVLNDGQGAQSA
jgi:hypothetical protein